MEITISIVIFGPNLLDPDADAGKTANSDWSRILIDTSAQP